MLISGRLSGKRAVAAVVLLLVFYVVVRGGAPLMMLATLLSQLACSKELLQLGYERAVQTRRSQHDDFKHISGYFVLCALIYCWCANLLVHMQPSSIAHHVARHYRLVCFCLHLAGVVWFVANLDRRHRRRQFALLAYTHVVAVLVVAQSALIVRAAADDAMWFVVGVTSVAANDIFAYVCGTLFGRTPLIGVSPRKTREGFAAAAVGSVLVTCLVAYVGVERSAPSPTGRPLHRLTSYHLLAGVTVQMYPIVVHTFWLALFAALVAPFGGFFASGLKRACNVKDFGATIPGHGGVMDRFDCQLLMISFLNVYIGAFAGPTIEEHRASQHLFERIIRMSDAQQVELLHLLHDHLLH